MPIVVQLPQLINAAAYIPPQTGNGRVLANTVAAELMSNMSKSRTPATMEGRRQTRPMHTLIARIARAKCAVPTLGISRVANVAWC